MKQPIHVWLLVALACAGAIFVIIFGFRTFGSNEIQRKPIQVGQEAVPAYLKDKLPPALQQKIRQATSQDDTEVTNRATKMGQQAPTAPTQIQTRP